eukprot:GHVS01029648.1.p1 GENE.GHVS01029648.1~~GHVS01029648.1.p1  ORF type:complete len:828 (-),score=82.00 GHVS01029648.1:27-2510(-)
MKQNKLGSGGRIWNTSDIPVAQSRVEEVRCFLQQFSSLPSHDNLPPLVSSRRLLIIRGPPGCGKHSLLTALCRDISLPTRRWQPPPACRSGKGGEEDGIGGEAWTQDDGLGNSLIRFLTNCKQFQPLPLFPSQGRYAVTLLDDPPRTLLNSKNFRQRLHCFWETFLGIEGQARTQKMTDSRIPVNPVVLVCCNGDSSDWKTLNRMFPPSIDIFNHSRVQVVTFCPITKPQIQKCIYRLLSISSTLSTSNRSSISSSIANTAGGDLHAALAALRMATAGASHVAEAASSYRRAGSSGAKKTRGKGCGSRRGNKPSEAQTAAAVRACAVASSRDSAYAFFPLAGKLLYAKRIPVDPLCPPPISLLSLAPLGAGGRCDGAELGRQGLKRKNENVTTERQIKMRTADDNTLLNRDHVQHLTATGTLPVPAQNLPNEPSLQLPRPSPNIASTTTTLLPPRHGCYLLDAPDLLPFLYPPIRVALPYLPPPSPPDSLPYLSHPTTLSDVQPLEGFGSAWGVVYSRFNNFVRSCEYTKKATALIADLSSATSRQLNSLESFPKQCRPQLYFDLQDTSIQTSMSTKLVDILQANFLDFFSDLRDAAAFCHFLATADAAFPFSGGEGGVGGVRTGGGYSGRRKCGGLGDELGEWYYCNLSCRAVLDCNLQPTKPASKGSIGVTASRFGLHQFRKSQEQDVYRACAERMAAWQEVQTCSPVLSVSSSSFLDILPATAALLRFSGGAHPPLCRFSRPQQFRDLLLSLYSDAGEKRTGDLPCCGLPVVERAGSITLQPIKMSEHGEYLSDHLMACNDGDMLEDEIRCADIDDMHDEIERC